jgi:fatty acid synthase subunit alpha
VRFLRVPTLEVLIDTTFQSSFGFGQVGGIAMIIHPRYIFGALDPIYYDGYKQRNGVRALQSYKAMSDMMIKNSLVKIKEHPPYIGDMEGKVLLNSMARATFDPKTGEYSFKGKLSSTAPMDTSNVQTITKILSMNNIFDGSAVGVGVDQGVLII